MKKNLLFTGVFLLIVTLGKSQSTSVNLTGHESKVNTVVFSPDSKFLFSGSSDGTIREWECANNFNCNKILKIGNAVKSIDFSPTKNEFSVATLQKIMVYTFPSLKIRKEQSHAHTTFVECANYSYTGDYLISSSWRDNCLSLWKSESLKKVLDLNETNWTAKAIFIPGDQLIASGNHANAVCIWSAKDGTLLHTLAGHTDWVESIQVSSDGKTLYSGSLDHSIKIWDVVSGKLIKTLSGHTDGITALSLSSDGKYIASGSMDKTIVIWDLATYEQVVVLKGQEKGVLSLAFSSDGEKLASGGMDNLVRVWDLKNTLKK